MSESQQPPAPRRLAPGETPKRLQWYWATHEFGDGTGDVIRYDPTDSDMDNYTDFYGPLTDPRDARATLQTLHTPAAAFGSSEAGKKGGAARAEKLSSEERSAIAKRAAQARWAASKSSDKTPETPRNS